MNDRNSICRESHVELDCISAQRYGLSERFDRIFGSVSAIPAVSNYGSGRRIEENVHSRNLRRECETERHTEVRRSVSPGKLQLRK